MLCVYTTKLLKGSDFIQGKTIQLSSDKFNSLSVGSDNGLYNKPSNSLVGAGWHCQSEIFGRGSSEPSFNNPFYFFPHIKYTKEELSKKRFILIGEKYFCVELDQSDFKINAIEFTNVSHSYGSADTNMPLISYDDKEMGSQFIRSTFIVENINNSINQSSKTVVIDGKKYAIVHNSEICCYLNVYPHLLSTPGREKDIISAATSYSVRVTTTDFVQVAELVSYQLYEVQ